MNQYNESYEFSIGAMSEAEFFQYIMSQPPSWMLVYITVFTIYFYMSESSSGFIKNYISMHNARIYSVISKIIILALFVVIILIVAICTNWIGRYVFFDSVQLGDLVLFAKLLIGQFLLQWAFAILILYVTMITKNTIVSLLIGMLISFNVLGIALAALDSLIDPIQIAPYWLVNTISSTTDYHHNGEFMQIIAIAVVYIVVVSFTSTRYKLKENL